MPAPPPATAPAIPQVTQTTPFQVVDVTGPAKGTTLCYVCRYGGRPSLVVFTRTLDGHFPDVAKAAEKFVVDNKERRAAGFVVLLGSNTKANRDTLAKLADTHKLTIPLTIAADGPKGPADYKLGGNFDTLVLVTRRNRVQSSFPLQCTARRCARTDCAQTGDILAAARGALDES